MATPRKRSTGTALEQLVRDLHTSVQTLTTNVQELSTAVTGKKEIGVPGMVSDVSDLKKDLASLATEVKDGFVNAKNNQSTLTKEVEELKTQAVKLESKQTALEDALEVQQLAAKKAEWWAKGAVAVIGTVCTIVGVLYSAGILSINFSKDHPPAALVQKP